MEEKTDKKYYLTVVVRYYGAQTLPDIQAWGLIILLNKSNKCVRIKSGYVCIKIPSFLVLIKIVW